MPAPQPANQRRFITIQAAASYLDCDPKTIRRMIARGDIHGYRYGERMVRVDQDEVDAALTVIPTAGGRDG
jgi:excisionase family DNA binding protein